MRDDFNFERGGYKADPMRPAIIASLERDHYQTTRSLCKNTGLKLDAAVSILEGDDEITSKMVGASKSFFLKRNQPNGTLYNTGKAFRVKQEKPVAADPHRGHKAPTQERLDLKKLEEFGRRRLSHKQIALELGIKYNSVGFYLGCKRYPQYGEAYRKGKTQSKNTPVNEKKKQLTGNRPQAVLYPFSLNEPEIDGLLQEAFGGLSL